MIRNLDTKTSILICSVFLLRILFFSIVLTSSQNLRSDNAKKIRSHFLTVMKRKLLAADEGFSQRLRSSAEICEERDLNGGKDVESNHFLIQFLYSLRQNHIISKLTRFTFFNQDHSFSSSPRYILLQILRT
jgi:hypothetical protein